MTCKLLSGFNLRKFEFINGFLSEYIQLITSEEELWWTSIEINLSVTYILYICVCKLNKDCPSISLFNSTIYIWPFLFFITRMADIQEEAIFFLQWYVTV